VINVNKFPLVKRDHEQAAVNFLSSIVCFKEDAAILLYSKAELREELLRLYEKHAFSKEKVEKIRRAIRSFQMCKTVEEVRKVARVLFQSPIIH